MTEWIWESLATTSLLVVAILLIRRPMARLFGPVAAYWLWLIPAMRLFLPPFEQEIAVPASAFDTAAIGIAGETGNAVPPPALGSSGLDELSVSHWSQSIEAAWPEFAFIIWLSGAALIFLIQMLRYVSMRDILLAEATDLGEVGGVKLIESDQIKGPLAFGLFRRYIAVPLDFAKIFSAQERELALAHEMAHHKSGDLFANFVGFIVLCLTWFNPFSWIAWNAFRFDQEAACDARVLEGRDGAAKQAYGRTLARAAHHPAPAFAIALGSPKTIIARLRNLTMKDISKKRRLVGKLGVVAALAITLPLTATIFEIPVAAQDDTTADKSAEKQAEKRTVIITKKRDGKEGEAPSDIKISIDGEDIDLTGDKDTPFVKSIKRDGKLIVLRTNKELSDVDFDKLVSEAEASLQDIEWSEKEGAPADGKGVKVKIFREKDGDKKSTSTISRTFSYSSDAPLSEASSSVVFSVNGDAGDLDDTDECVESRIGALSGSSGKGEKASKIVTIFCGKPVSEETRKSTLQSLKRFRGKHNIVAKLKTPQPPEAPQPPEPPAEK